MLRGWSTVRFGVAEPPFHPPLARGERGRLGRQQGQPTLARSGQTGAAGGGSRRYRHRPGMYRVLLAVPALAIPFLLPALGRLQSTPLTFTLVEWCVSIMVALTGVLGGAAFALAAGLQLQITGRAGPAAGTIVGADHAGACLGALLSGILPVPVFGTAAAAGLTETAVCRLGRAVTAGILVWSSTMEARRARASRGAVEGSGSKCRTPWWWHGAKRDTASVNGAGAKLSNGTPPAAMPDRCLERSRILPATYLTETRS